METNSSKLMKFTFVLLVCLVMMMFIFLQNDYYTRQIDEKNEKIEELEQTIKDQTYQFEHYEDQHFLIQRMQF